MNTIHKINPTVALLTGVIACVIAFMAMSSLVFAQEAGNAEDVPAGSTLEQRIAQRKAEQGVVLEDKDQKRVIATCVNAQSKARASQATVIEALNSRAKVYQRVDGRIWTITGKLKLAEKDTFEFEKQGAEFADKVTAFKATGENYKQALDDIAVINCKGDPEGFKALVQTGRFYNALLREQSADLKDYAINTLKPSLSAFAANLQGGAPVSEESTGE